MNLEAEISLKKAMVILIVAVLLFLLGFFAIGKMFFWDQYSQDTLDDVKVKEAKVNVERNPKDFKAHIALATTYYDEGNYDDALKEARVAQKLGKNVVVNYTLGLIYVQTKQYDLAIKNLGIALKNNPIEYETLVNMGYAYEGKKDYKKALNYYDQALRVEPGSADVLVSKSLVYEKMGNKKEALKLVNDALKYVPDYKEWLDIKARLTK